MCKVCSELKIKRRQWRRSYIFTNNFEQISLIGLVFQILTDFEQVNAS